MCCSSSATKSPMAQFIKSQSPEELWKASLKPKDPLKPVDPAVTPPVAAAKAAGTGLLIDTTA